MKKSLLIFIMCLFPMFAWGADSTIGNLGEIGNTAIDDQIAIVDVSESPDTTKRVSVNNIVAPAYFADSTEADQGAAGSGRSVKDLVDLIGSNNATIVLTHHGSATTDYIFGTDETIPSNITLKIQKGARASIAAAQTLTINGSFDAGLYQVFSGAGSVSFSVGSIDGAYPQWWPECLPDGSTNCQPAYTKAITALPVNGTIHITQGKWNFSTTLSFNKAINFIGDGTRSVIYLTGGTDVDGIIVGSAANYTNAITWKDFAILGAANSCQNALILRTINNSHFENVHVHCGTAATGAAVWIQWGIINHYNFIHSGNIAYPETSANSVYGIKITEADDSATVSNANEFDCVIENTTGKGLYQYASGGNNYIRGIYEGIQDYGIHIKDGYRVRLHNIHSETNDPNTNEIVIEDHTDAYIGPAVFSVSAGTGYNDIQLINSQNTRINGLSCNRLSIDANSNYTDIISVRYVGQTDKGLYNLSTNTRQSSIPDLTKAIQVGQSSDNSSILNNGSFERWTTVTTAPPGWITSGMARERESTIVKHGNHSIKLTSTTTAQHIKSNSNTAETAALPAYSTLVASGWVYIPTTGGNNVEINIYYDTGAEVLGGVQTVTARDEWVRVSFAYPARGIAENRTCSQLYFFPAVASTIFYLDGWSIVPSVVGAAITYTPNASEFPIYTGTTTWNPGSIAASGYLAVNITCPGAALGMVANAGAGVDVVDLIVSATVTVADVVTVVLFNPTGGAIDLASSTWNVEAKKLF